MKLDTAFKCNYRIRVRGKKCTAALAHSLVSGFVFLSGTNTVTILFVHLFFRENPYHVFARGLICNANSIDLLNFLLMILMNYVVVSFPGVMY